MCTESNEPATGKLDASKADGYPNPMVMTAVPEVAAELKDYDAEKLEPVTEINSLAELVARLRQELSYSAAEAACQSSRRVRLAVEQEAWESSFGPQSQSSRHRAICLLTEIDELESPTMAALSGPDAAVARRFFSNMAHRKNLLSQAVS